MTDYDPKGTKISRAVARCQLRSYPLKTLSANQRRTTVARRVALILIVSSIFMVFSVYAENTGQSQDEIAIRKAA